MSNYQALEGIFFSRQCTQNSDMFKIDCLVDWMAKTMPSLRPLGRLKQLLNQKSEYDLNETGRNGSTMRNAWNTSATSFNQTLNFADKSFYANYDYQAKVYQTVKQLDKMPNLRKNLE